MHFLLKVRRAMVAANKQWRNVPYITQHTAPMDQCGGYAETFQYRHDMRATLLCAEAFIKLAAP